LIHLPDTAFAQQPARAFFVSVSPSVGTVPADYLNGCTSSRTEWSASIAVDVGLRSGGYRLTARAGRAGSAELLSQSACSVVEPIAIEDGTHTLVVYPHRRGAYTFTELRGGREFHAGIDWHAELGGGYAWLPEAPYGIGVLGFRLGRSLRVGLDAELRIQRVSNTLRTQRWEDFRPIELLSESTRTEWVTTPALRLAFEVRTGL
jgi:hypothetical protein